MDLDFTIILDNIGYLADGFKYTLELTCGAVVGGMLLGALLAIARISTSKLAQNLAAAYVTVMRSIPLMLVLFWIFFLSPLVLQWLMSSGQPIKVDAKATAMVTFILFEGAYFCEIIRSGIRSVRPGQWAASAALGLSTYSTMTYVILPQALRNMLPVLLTQVVVLFQDTSLVYVISATDLVGAASTIGQRDGTLVEPYLFVALTYLAISVLLSTMVTRLARRQLA